MNQLTPASSGGGIYRPADFATLTQALDYAAQGQAGLNFFSGKGDLQESLSYGALRDASQSIARRMRIAGLGQGERVAIIAETDANFVRAFFACQYAGLVPVPMPLPMADFFLNQIGCLRSAPLP